MARIAADTLEQLELGADATGGDLHQAGLACSTGQGAALCYVEAHKWFNLAALAGVEEAKAHRREIAALMSAEEIALAQANARAWLTSSVHRSRGSDAAGDAMEAAPMAVEAAA
jgi:TPR repeat protein